MLYYYVLCDAMLCYFMLGWHFYAVHGHVNRCCFCWCVEGIMFIYRPESVMMECYIYASMFMAVWLLWKVGVRRINPWGKLLKQGGLVVIIHKSLDDLLVMFAFDCVAKTHVICRSWVTVNTDAQRLCVLRSWDRRHRFLISWCVNTAL